LEDIDGKRKEESKNEANGMDQTNYPDDKTASKTPVKTNKIAPDGKPAEEEEILKTEEDDAKFLKRLGTEPYIRFADFAKYLSLFNSRTGIDEKI
jgi:hypothetical protein